MSENTRADRDRESRDGSEYLDRLAEEYADVPDLYMTNGLWPSSLGTDEEE